MRIGHGFDVHAFEAGDYLMLGGVAVPFEQSFRAHSDGDVALHALTDALLGAAGLGDIGRHFPDTDPAYHKVDSRELLRHSIALLHERQFHCSSADLTIVAQRPKLSPYIDTMCGYIAADLQLDITRVNVKATTSEHLGFCGRGEGIAAFAVVLLEEI